MSAGANADLDGTSNADARMMSGIDILVLGNPTLEILVDAVGSIYGIERHAMKLPDDSESQLLDILGQEKWAVVARFPSGDFRYKHSLDGKSKRDYTAIARMLARRLKVPVAWPDESTQATTAMVLCAPNGATRQISVDDLDVLDSSIEGFVVSAGMSNSRRGRISMSYPFAALLIASLASSIIISTSLFLVPLGFPWFAWIALGLAVLIVAGRETLTVADGAGGNIDFAKTLLIKLIMCVYFVFGLAAVTGFISLKWPIYFMLFSWLVVYVVIWTLNRNTE